MLLYLLLANPIGRWYLRRCGTPWGRWVWTLPCALVLLTVGLYAYLRRARRGRP